MADINEIIIDGQPRKFGNVERPQGLLRAWPLYGSTPTTPLIDRTDWPKFIRPDFRDSPARPPVRSQGALGCCNCSATCSAIESCRITQGLLPVDLSAGDMYRRISGGIDQGSTLEDGLHAAMTDGVATTATVPYLDWQHDHTGAAAERPKYRVIEAFLCPTFEACMSAVIEGFRLISGVQWLSGYSPDTDGWLPHKGTVVGGHAIFGYAPAQRGSDFGIWCNQSWGNWGPLGGRFVLPEFAYGGPIGGLWAVRSVIDEGNVVPIP